MQSADSITELDLEMSELQPSCVGLSANSKLIPEPQFHISVIYD